MNENHNLQIPKVETKKDFYGVALTIDTKYLKSQKEEAMKNQEFDKMVDIVVVIDGVRREMTIEEFTKRITTNVR